MGRANCRQLADARRRAAVVDVSDRAAIDAALDEVRSALGPVEIMVTSAGIEGFTEFLDITAEAWDRMLAVNLTGTFHCLQAAVPDMIEVGWGRIVTISSSSAQSGTRRLHQGAGPRPCAEGHHGEHHSPRRHRHPDDASTD
jgi:2-hydroxycyclohexanecarboxyl-CoA dehydrogenase